MLHVSEPSSRAAIGGGPLVYTHSYPPHLTALSTLGPIDIPAPDTPHARHLAVTKDESIVRWRVAPTTSPSGAVCLKLPRQVTAPLCIVISRPPPSLVNVCFPCTHDAAVSSLALQVLPSKQDADSAGYEDRPLSRHHYTLVWGVGYSLNQSRPECGLRRRKTEFSRLGVTRASLQPSSISGFKGLPIHGSADSRRCDAPLPPVSLLPSYPHPARG
jgi:hypothetical protein